MNKKIALLLTLILFLPLNAVFAEWKQAGQGVYVADFARNGDYITYSTKLDKTSATWKQYMTEHNFTSENMGNFNNMVIKATYDCSQKSIMINSIQFYDASGNQMGAFVDQTWKKDPNNAGNVICDILN